MSQLSGKVQQQTQIDSITMQADNPNAKLRWQSVSNWYDELIGETNWGFLRPMVELTAWVATQPWNMALFPNTSHAALCVKMIASDDPNAPFFSCNACSDGKLEFELWSAAGRRIEQRRFPLDESHSAFVNFVQRLQNVA